MLRPNSSPQTDSEGFPVALNSRELTKVAKGIAAAGAAVTAGLLSACVAQEPCPESHTFIPRGIGMAFGSKDDTGDTSDSATDSSDSGDSAVDSGLDSTDSAETGDSATDSGDSAETAPPPVPDTIGTWPTGTPGTTISGEMMAAYASFEPSGVTENGDSLLVVGDDGELAQLASDGSLENYANLGSTIDAEGVTVNSATGMAAIADEALIGIREFDLTSWALTGEYCTLDLPEAAPLGFEGLSFVPAANAPAAWGSDLQGFYVAGSQSTSDLYVYAASDCVSGAPTLTHLATIPTTADDVSGVSFNTWLFVLHDNSNSFDVLDPDGTLMATYALPTTGQEEGIDVRGDCDSALWTLTIAYDGSTTTPMSYDNSVIAYNDFPVTCH